MTARKRGTVTMEYTVLAVALILALVAIQASLRRAIAGRWRASVDVLGEGRQYDPAATTITH